MYCDRRIRRRVSNDDGTNLPPDAFICVRLFSPADLVRFGGANSGSLETFHAVSAGKRIDYPDHAGRFLRTVENRADASFEKNAPGVSARIQYGLGYGVLFRQ